MTRILLIPVFSYRRKFHPLLPSPGHRRRPFFIFLLIRFSFVFIAFGFYFRLLHTLFGPPPRRVPAAADLESTLVSDGRRNVLKNWFAAQPRFRVWRERLANKCARKIRTDISRTLLQPIIRTSLSPKAVVYYCLLAGTKRRGWNVINGVCLNGVLFFRKIRKAIRFIRFPSTVTFRCRIGNTLYHKVHHVQWRLVCVCTSARALLTYLFKDEFKTLNNNNKT